MTFVAYRACRSIVQTLNFTKFPIQYTSTSRQNHTLFYIAGATLLDFLKTVLLQYQYSVSNSFFLEFVQICPIFPNFKLNYCRRMQKAQRMNNFVSINGNFDAIETNHIWVKGGH